MITDAGNFINFIFERKIPNTKGSEKVEALWNFKLSHLRYK